MRLAMILIGMSYGSFAAQWAALMHPVAPLMLSVGFGFASMWVLRIRSADNHSDEDGVCPCPEQG